MKKIVIEETKIIKKTNIGSDNYRVTLAPFSKVRNIKPGQFVHVDLPARDIYFRRAFSVYDVNIAEKSFSILFKAVGRGTICLAKMKPGAEISVLGPLGNGFRPPTRREKVILAAGGVGLPPLFFLARTLIEKGFDPNKIFLFYGAADKSDLLERSRINKLGVRFYPATDDGSFGFKGLVTSVMASRLDELGSGCQVYACGPEPMLKAVERLSTGCGWAGQLSLEAPMPCGVGVCLGCIRPLVAGGYTRVCHDGPVYNVGEVLL